LRDIILNIAKRVYKEVLWKNELNILENDEMYYNSLFTDFVLTVAYNLRD